MKKFHFNTEEMKAIQTLASEIVTEMNPALTTAENLRRSYMKRTSGNATGIAEELMSGIATFDGMYRDSKSRSPYQIIRTHLQDLLDQADPDRRGVILHSIIRGAYETLGEEMDVPEGMMPAAMLEIAISAIEEMSLAGLVSEGNPLGQMDAAATARLFADLCHAADGNAMAMAAYILHRQGQLPSLPENTTAAQIGAITAASVAARDSIVESIQGKADMDKIIKALKVIAALTVIALIVIGTPMVLKASVAAVARFCIGVFGAKMLFVESMLSWMLIGATTGTILGAVTVGACEIGKAAGVPTALCEIWQALSRYVRKHIAPRVSLAVDTTAELIREAAEPVRQKITAAREKAVANN